MFLCFICDETQRVTRSKHAPGVCGICGAGCSKVRLRRVFRTCFIPIWVTWNREVLCARPNCRARLRRY